MAEPAAQFEEVQPKPPDIELTSRFQEFEWIIQRVFWALLALVLLAAAFGLFGNGPWSKRSLSFPSFDLAYERFIRYETPTSLILTAQAGSRGVTELFLSQEMVEALTIERIVPRPNAERSEPDGVHYEFIPPAHKLAVKYKAQERGQLTGEIGWNSERITLSQFVYP